MKKNLFLRTLILLVILFSVRTEAQMTIGGKKQPEPFSVLELLNKGGLRLPQMTNDERNAFAVRGNDKGEGLTIYNTTTGCVEYWNKIRWVSLCEGSSQTSITPDPCLTVLADGTGCDDTFKPTDPDCPNGPFIITIVAGSEYATLANVNENDGSFKIYFQQNETVNTHTVLVRVTSKCTSLYKEFLFSQNGVDCSSMTYSAPIISPATATLSLCSGGAVYLSVPGNTPNLDKLIWTRNGIEVARGVSYYVATQKGKYNVSMGAVGCNTNVSNERTVTESGTTAPSNISILASNNGVLCGSNSVTLTASGASGTVAWFHKGVEERTGTSVTLNGDSNVGEWFAAVKNGGCYSKQSNIIVVTKSNATGQVDVPANNVLVNGIPLLNVSNFCSGGSLDLTVANKTNGVTYTWYNGNDAITSNPFIVPGSQTTISLRMVATDNSGAQCPAELSVIEKSITGGDTPVQPNITGNAILCDGSTDLTIVPAVPGTYTYTWYKDGVKMTENTATITVTTPGVIYSASVTNQSGCTSPLALKAVSATVSSIPVLSWVSKPTTANYGGRVTLQTAIEFGPATSYTWTADNNATVIGSGSSVTIQLPGSGGDGAIETVTVTAQNSCGKSVPLQHTFTINNVCPTPVVTAQSDLSQNTLAGTAVTEKVSVADGVGASYQWYSNTIASTTGGSITTIGGATASTFNYTPANPGTYYLFCVVTNGCVGAPKGTSPVFTVVAAINPGNILKGTGTLIGNTCFDIAESNDNTTCGTLSTRLATKANFNLEAVNTQTYTFTTSGIVSKVRFVYVESLSGAIVQELTPVVDKSQALNVSGSVSATLIYKSSLSTSNGVQGTAYGKNTAGALYVDVYAVYNDNANGSGTDRAVKLRATIKDCACCGAKVSATLYKTFLCHNLGADSSLDPFTPNIGLKGTFYNEYGDNCPAGYRKPTKDELTGLLDYNTVTWVGDKTKIDGTSGIKVGQNLFFPSTGYGTPYNGSVGGVEIWSSTFNLGAATLHTTSTYNLQVGYTQPNIVTMNVRCIAN